MVKYCMLLTKSQHFLVIMSRKSRHQNLLLKAVHLCHSLRDIPIIRSVKDFIINYFVKHFKGGIQLMDIDIVSYNLIVYIR